MGEIKIEAVVVGAIGTNCYIVYNDESKEAIIIDPGAQSGKIEEKVKALKLNPVAVFLTHGHFDHIMAAADIANAYNIKINIHEEENDVVSDCQMNGSSMMAGKGYALDPHILLKDNQSIDILGTKIRIIHTPGHTKGGCCYYFENEGLLFSGDTLFMESVGRTDLPTGNGRKLLESVNDKLMILPEAVKVFPGHGPSTSIANENRNNPYVSGL